MTTPELAHMKHAAPEFVRRRRLVLACGGAALAGLAAGCATPPAVPLRPIVAAQAPRVGDAWRYRYTSGWKNVAPRTVIVQVSAVSTDSVRDALSVEGASGMAEGDFTSRLEIAQRAAGGLDVVELSPYLQAFDALQPGAQAQVAMPPARWGSEWMGSARFAGMERVAVPAGTFDAVRVDVYGRRFFLVGQMDDAVHAVKLYVTAWYAAQVKRYVRLAVESWAAGLNPLARDLYELDEYRRSG
jgi:hypothetical protein